MNRIIEHANRWHQSREVVSRLSSGEVVRHSYGDIYVMAARLSQALLRFGIEQGQCVGTMAMNGSRHLAAWYGIFGIGAAVIRSIQDCTWSKSSISSSTHRTASFWRMAILFASPKRCSIDAQHWKRSCCCRDQTGTKPETVDLNRSRSSSPDARMIRHGSRSMRDRRRVSAIHPALLATQKGCCYSHRSNCLHALMSIQPDLFNLRAVDVILPIVPMYHANAWGLAFSAPAVGAKLVLPGVRLDGASIANLIASERVTFAAGVPTVALALLDEFQRRGTAPLSLKRFVVGGAAISERIIREFDELGITAIHTWGMTEMSPLGCASTPTAATESLGLDEQMALRLKQGRPYWGVDMRLVDERGLELPRDGRTVGALRVKGPGVSRGYFRDSSSILSADGFFDTSDLATIDPFGFMKITDRAKDVIKSGGEWISSQELERAALSHRHAAMAAVIGMYDPKWGERPLLLIKLKQGSSASAGEFREHLAQRVAKWWLPDQIIFVDELPLGGTGKIDKKKLRENLSQLLSTPS